MLKDKLPMLLKNINIGWKLEKCDHEIHNEFVFYAQKDLFELICFENA